MPRAFYLHDIPEASSRILVIAAILLLSLIPGISRAQGFRGSLVGSVVDSTGGRVQSADIQLQATESPLERKTKSDTRGEFSFGDLPPGAYKVTVRAPGFADASSNVAVI